MTTSIKNAKINIDFNFQGSLLRWTPSEFQVIKEIQLRFGTDKGPVTFTVPVFTEALSSSKLPFRYHERIDSLQINHQLEVHDTALAVTHSLLKNVCIFANFFSAYSSSTTHTSRYNHSQVLVSLKQPDQLDSKETYTIDFHSSNNLKILSADLVKSSNISIIERIVPTEEIKPLVKQEKISGKAEVQGKIQVSADFKGTVFWWKSQECHILKSVQMVFRNTKGQFIFTAVVFSDALLSSRLLIRRYQCTESNLKVNSRVDTDYSLNVTPQLLRNVVLTAKIFSVCSSTNTFPKYTQVSIPIQLELPEKLEINRAYTLCFTSDPESKKFFANLIEDKTASS